MKKYLDINKIYTTTEGEAFAHVILDNRKGIEQPNGSYQVSPSEDTIDSLSSDQYSIIKSTCSTGDSLLAEGTSNATIAAFKSYAEALNQIPEPALSWNATGWILSRMGECYFRLDNFEQAEQLYADLMWCPGAIGNPWIHLRNGQINLELGKMHRAGDELIRAYMGGGKEIFSLEDPKYYQYLNRIADGLG